MIRSRYVFDKIDNNILHQYNRLAKFNSPFALTRKKFIAFVMQNFPKKLIVLDMNHRYT